MAAVNPAVRRRGPQRITDLAPHDELGALALLPVERIPQVSKLLLRAIERTHLLLNGL